MEWVIVLGTDPPLMDTGLLVSGGGQDRLQVPAGPGRPGQPGQEQVRPERRRGRRRVRDGGLRRRRLVRRRLGGRLGARAGSWPVIRLRLVFCECRTLLSFIFWIITRVITYLKEFYCSLSFFIAFIINCVFVDLRDLTNVLHCFSFIKKI